MFIPSIPNKYPMKKIKASRHGYTVSFHAEAPGALKSCLEMMMLRDLLHVCVSRSVVSDSL